ncbi:MAG: NAD(P)H-dependent glycerol-3-phosphate dehydrogenase [Candidatus Kerfeldbacteria bacterium]|nr:NAD(P)H-dependent glycerol-3-phosphate dehydrogenase [Candidatus Kerfeldbacteria bacterium]
MNAIILAAGESKRLRAVVSDIPKSLVHIGPKAILDYQLDALRAVGVIDVTVVVGYMAQTLMEHCTTAYPDLRFHFVFNPIYGQTNTVYSLWLARNAMTDDFLYFNADVVTHPLVVERLVRSSHPTCLAVNKARTAEEEVKVILRDDSSIGRIGKTLNPTEAAGEFIGIAKFAKAYAPAFAEALDAVVGEGNVNAFFELAVDRTLEQEKLYALDISDLPTIEVDTPEDLERAQALAGRLQEPSPAVHTDRTLTRTRQRLAVLGHGAWGTTIAQVLAENGHDVCLWVREKGDIAAMQSAHTNARYLPDVTLAPSLSFSNSPADTVRNATTVVVVVPAQYVRPTMKLFRGCITDSQRVVSAAKGIEVDTFKLMTDVIQEALGRTSPVAVLSGPNIAREVAMHHPSKSVVATERIELGRELRDLLTNEYFKVYVNTDVRGVEIAGALKNILAIAAGIADGLGYGMNTKAAMITRGLRELIEIGKMLHGRSETFSGLAGIGDVMVTCTSPGSRNRSVGQWLAEGVPVDQLETKLQGRVAEGIPTTKAVYQYAQRMQLTVPIIENVYRVLYDHASPREAFRNMWNRRTSLLEW